MTPQTTDQYTIMMDAVDTLRLSISPQLETERKGWLGQYLTRKSIATFMAGLFNESRLATVRLLDPGAGIGVLSAAFLERRHATGNDRVGGAVTAYEIDPALQVHLGETLETYRTLTPAFTVQVLPCDFIEDSARLLRASAGDTFTHAILNPPYRKIHSDSEHRRFLRSVGIETVNLYTAFVALTVLRMEQGAEVVAIIPRSFCNGPYYRPFRELLLSHTAIEHIHLFESRTSAFSDDDVLQENIIIKLIVGKQQGRVTVSTSHDARFIDVRSSSYAFENIVLPKDAQCFIHIPTAGHNEGMVESPVATHTLSELGIQVSTGPVVDFRLKEFLRAAPSEDTAPLLYPGHFVQGQLSWPRENGKKPNAIVQCAQTVKWLYPKGWYTVVRRFSSKEERKRVVAYVVDPSAFHATMLGFENHFNVFHSKRAGLNEYTALGMSVYLNCTDVDKYFRRFSGHTQVNATDLRTMRYPSAEILKALGEWAGRTNTLSQEAIDNHLSTYAT